MFHYSNTRRWGKTKALNEHVKKLEEKGMTIRAARWSAQDILEYIIQQLANFFDPNIKEIFETFMGLRCDYMLFLKNKNQFNKKNIIQHFNTRLDIAEAYALEKGFKEVLSLIRQNRRAIIREVEDNL